MLSSYRAATAAAAELEPEPEPEPGAYTADWGGGNAGDWRGESIGEWSGDLPAEMLRDACDLFVLNSRMNTEENSGRTTD